MSTPVQRSIRLTGKEAIKLDITSGSNGEIFFDSTNNSLRVFDGRTTGGHLLSAGLSLEETQDIIASMFTVGIAHNGLTATYIDSTGKISLTGFSGSYADLTNKPALFSGSYNDLTNKPSIPAGQVQVDWDATTGVAAILNKPTIFSGSYNDLTDLPSIPGEVNLTGYATESYVGTQITNLIGTAGTALNTLGELSDALADDASFASTVTTTLSAKAPIASPTFTGTVTVPSATTFSANEIAISTGGVSVARITSEGLDIYRGGISLDDSAGAGGGRLEWRNSSGLQSYIQGIGTAIGSPAGTGDNGLGFQLDATDNNYAMTMSQNNGFVFRRAIIETMSPNMFASGVTTHDLKASAGVFYQENLSGNFIPDFTNVPINILGTISVAVIVIQGTPAYMPVAVRINGSSQTIKWQGGSAPTGTENGVDVVSFTFIRTGNLSGNGSSGTWTVLGASGGYA